MIKISILILVLVFSKIAYSEEGIDQWKDSNKTYKDLIEEGFEVKAYDTSTINAKGGIVILLFITVLQKNNIVFECQEYQTLDDSMITLDMSLVCRELSQPYTRGVGI
jgi:hypothetical protein